MSSELSKTVAYPFPDQLLDQDGYPTEAALLYLRNWSFFTDEETKELCFGVYFSDWEKQDQLIEFLRSIWYFSDMGFTYNHPYLEISTFGWSGNEEVIEALKNTNLWISRLEAHITGGHYFFRLDSNAPRLIDRIVAQEQQRLLTFLQTYSSQYPQLLTSSLDDVLAYMKLGHIDGVKITPSENSSNQ